MKKLLFLSLGLFVLGCSGEDESPKVATAFSGPESGVVEVPYDGIVHLNTLFSTNGTGATLVYTLTKATPDYADITTNDAYVAVSANPVYSINADGVLSSAAVRVPDVLKTSHSSDGTVAADNTYARNVVQGQLQVEFKVGDVKLDSKTYDIIQTGKPDLMTVSPPVLSFSTTLAAGSADNNRTYSMNSREEDVAIPTSDFFKVTPIDYDYKLSRIAVRAQADPGYITVDATGGGQIKAGATVGEGKYLVGFYNPTPRGEDETLEAYNTRLQPLFDAAVASGNNRVYVKVTEGPEPVRVVVRDAALDADLAPMTMTFKEGAAGSWKGTTTILMVLMNDGTYKPTNDSSVSAKWGTLKFSVGNFDANLEGRSGGASYENASHPGWHYYFRQVSGVTVGTVCTYTITEDSHFGEEGWTFNVSIPVVAPSTKR